ncbi:UNVERIFIED_CONTAM: hypothetical protein HDU68_000631 [Siphonaria sp. JEL0065]|nr:hypothetical protein HDU68_000631 [Siphonaria sp. JEL0065]
MEILALGIGVSVGGFLLVILIALINKIIGRYSESNRPDDVAMLPIPIDTASYSSSDIDNQDVFVPTGRRPRNSLYHVYDGGSDSFLTADFATESRFEQVKALIRQISVSRKNGLNTNN